MIQTIKKAWAIPELRKKIVFTALMLLIFRIGNAIPVPYVNTELLGEYLNQLSTTVLGLYNVMSGGAFANATVFALGVQPYINSSIIIQLLTIAIPALERMARDGGEEGKKKIQSITRYATVAIAILQGWGYYVLMKNYGILTGSGVWVALVIIVSFIAGSSFVMWMGEQITEFGIGNGISIILFAGILSRVPSMVGSMGSSLRSGTMTWWMAVLVVLGILALIVLITWVNGAERRIPVQYAKRQVGRKMYGGQSSTLPMKVNMSGVLPIIFAQSIASPRVSPSACAQASVAPISLESCIGSSSVFPRASAAIITARCDADLLGRTRSSPCRYPGVTVLFIHSAPFFFESLAGTRVSRPHTLTKALQAAPRGSPCRCMRRSSSAARSARRRPPPSYPAPSPPPDVPASGARPARSAGHTP